MRARIALFLIFLLPATVFARGGRGGHSSGRSHSYGSHHFSGGTHRHSGTRSSSHRSGHHSSPSRTSHAQATKKATGKSKARSAALDRRANNKSSSGTVHVNGYYRKNGTYVHAYDRSAPGRGTSAKALPKGQAVNSSGPPTTNRASGSKSPTIKQEASNAAPQASQSSRQAFMSKTGYPQGRPGYLVGYIVPPKCGGTDDPSNLQWQTVEAAAKQKTESPCQH
jgi:hypothetical protein